MAVAYDTPIPGYNNDTVNTMRLWSAKAVEQFNFSCFNEGDYIKAVEDRIRLENISRVIYPDDTTYEGKSLRFKQQYFFVSASLQDILRRYKKSYDHFDAFPDKVAIQLNDTHPALAIVELMRLFLDEEHLAWDTAWNLTVRTFAYTNHTVLPEALEVWPVRLFEEVLPRHMQVLYEINYHFLNEVSQRYPDDHDLVARMSLIEEGAEKAVRMSHLAIVGSHAVNGVSRLHTEILKQSVFADFYRFYPEKFFNITNGISVRRWLYVANPSLTTLISSQIGDDWKKDVRRLRDLQAHTHDDLLLKAWQEVKRNNKQHLVAYIQEKLNINVDLDSLFDVQIKRVHEYKRQFLNILHVIHLYRIIKENPEGDYVKRTVIFSGKAAPGYHAAKLVIYLINAVAEVVNADKNVSPWLKVVFLPNYSVSLAELIIPAADLSEQISTAGMEASGTGNMKFALNGALTIATLDGANVEIAAEVGSDNIFLFGLTSPEVDQLREKGYDPQVTYQKNADLRAVVEMISQNVFSSLALGVFQSLVDELLGRDYFLNVIDFQGYLECQKKVEDLYRNPKEWAQKSILNVAGMGLFSGDRAVKEYADHIWNI
jgi:starch phosphorylase